MQRSKIYSLRSNSLSLLGCFLVDSTDLKERKAVSLEAVGCTMGWERRVMVARVGDYDCNYLLTGGREGVDA
jgi:hypothetical protein